MKSIAKMAAILSTVTAVFACSLFGQDRERPAPNYDEIVEHLGLSAGQVSCLEANTDAFREVASPHLEELRGLYREFRQTARDGGDTSEIQAEIEAARSAVAAIRSNHVVTASACIDPGQAAALAEVAAAETLQNEVRQAIGLLLFEATEENPRQDDANARRPNNRRGPRGGPPSN